MFIIGEVIIEDRVRHERFACDLASCKGACCTLPGGRGAPLEDDEAAEVQKSYPFVKDYLPEQHRRVIELQGMIEGVPGNYATVCVEEKACVFVHFEEGVARCAIERAFQEGRISWRKPLSCHLYPLRISKDAMPRVSYEEIPECKSGRARGRNLNVPLSGFLKEALVRRFGDAWYDTFTKACADLSGSPSS